MIPTHDIAVWRRWWAPEVHGAVRLDPDVFAFDAERVQRVLQEAHGTGRAQCLCGGTSDKEERLLAIRRLEDTYYLARYPNSRDQHRPDCRWAITEDRDRRGDDRGESEELRFALPIGRSLRAPETGEADDGPDRNRRESSRARARRTTLLGLFLWLWDEAELTWWHRGFAGRRTDWGAIARIRAAASKALWGGAPVADGMIVAPAGPWERGPWGFQRRLNRDCVQHALEHERRVLVLAEVVGPPAPLASKPGVLRFPVGSKPFPVGADPMGPPDLVDEVRHRYPRAWAALESGRRSRRIWLVAAAEPRARNGEPSPTLWLRTAALAMTTEAWLPVDSESEAVLADKLVREGRAFRKPVRLDASDDTLPDFELRDTGDRPMPLEVFGMDTPDYLAARERKAARNDQVLGPDGWWYWDAARDAEPPALPARRAPTRPAPAAPPGG